MGKIMMNGIQYGVGGIEQAKDISYDNTESGATATDVQGALDELNAGLTSYTEGIWKVRKYPDGTAECWGMTTISTNITSVWGSLFINAENSISFPSGLFIAMPVINLTAGGLNNSIPFITETTTKDELTYRVVRPTSQTVASVTVHAHAIGRWK